MPSVLLKTGIPRIRFNVLFFANAGRATYAVRALAPALGWLGLYKWRSMGEVVLYQLVLGWSNILGKSVALWSLLNKPFFRPFLFPSL